MENDSAEMHKAPPSTGNGSLPNAPLSLERRCSSRTFRYGYLVTT